MSQNHFTRPVAGEYNPYFDRYISLVPEGDVLALLQSQFEATLALLRSIPASHAGYRYAPDKWTVREVLGHIADTERVFADRALRIGRGDQNPLPGFDENVYVANGAFESASLDDLIANYENVRRSTHSLLSLMDATAAARTGTANGAAISVRALAYMVAGHELHHVTLFKSRYAEAFKAE